MIHEVSYPVHLTVAESRHFDAVAWACRRFWPSTGDVQGSQAHLAARFACFGNRTVWFGNVKYMLYTTT